LSHTTKYKYYSVQGYGITSAFSETLSLTLMPN